MNGDGRKDILFTGLTGPAGPERELLASLYLRNEDLSFSKAETDLNPGSTISVGDVNRDGNPDFLITGDETSLYLGDGRGNLPEANVDLPRKVIRSSTSISDLNGDRTPDLLLTGRKLIETDNGLERTAIANVYLGNGDGTFTKANADLEGVASGDVSTGDVNRDGIPDLLIMGGVTNLYLGNGDGSFRKANAGLIDVWGGATSIADLNGDGYQDLLVTGLNPRDPGLGLVSMLYVGDGTGRFERAEAGLAGGWSSSASVADVDRDGDQDLLMTVNAYNGVGEGTTLDAQTILYKNLTQQGVPEPQLLKTYPNPARNRVTVRYGVPEDADAARASFEVYDVLGRRVKSVPVEAEAGRHRRQFRVDGLTSGVYFLRINVGGQTRTQKLTVVR